MRIILDNGFLIIQVCSMKIICPYCKKGFTTQDRVNNTKFFMEPVQRNMKGEIVYCECCRYEKGVEQINNERLNEIK